MNYILFDDKSRNNLLPLTFTRPVADIRIGILTIREKWEKYLDVKISSLTQHYLGFKFPCVVEHDNLLINGSVLPGKELIREIKKLQTGQKLVQDNTLIALKLSGEQLNDITKKSKNAEKLIIDSLLEERGFIKIPTSLKCVKIENLWDIFNKNGEAIHHDFELLTKGRKSQTISNSNTVFGADKIFVEEGAKIEGAILNAITGPIYIDKDAEIMEGSIVRGPFALCEAAVLKLGTKIYGPTTIGPYSKAGGEINNSVIFGYSNKAHDGFLGNSVIGEWCNLGADTNNSNLKNNYSEIQVWNYNADEFINTGLQFCGLIMGDHSKCGINTMFNTGTVVGVNANIFGSGFPKKFIPCFSWGGSEGFVTFSLEKAFEVAQKVWERRNKAFDSVEKNIFTQIFELTSKYRS